MHVFRIHIVNADGSIELNVSNTDSQTQHLIDWVRILTKLKPGQFMDVHITQTVRQGAGELLPD